MSPLFRLKYGRRHRRLKRAVTAGVPCPFREQGRSTAGNMPSVACECGFCGKYMTRRAHNRTTTQTKSVWKCRTATNFGIENCPHSKSIDEAIIENTFLEMFHLLADNFDDVLDSVICFVEETLSDDESVVKLQRLDKSLGSMESKRKK